MTDTPIGDGTAHDGAGRAVPSRFTLDRGDLLRAGIGLALLAALIAVAYALHDTPGRGSAASFSLLIGALLGITFERGRFCFFCILRDFIEFRNSSALYSILAALAVGGVGYAVVFGAFLPNAFSGRLAPDAHIGPVSWATFAAGLAFGVGMALSGACISGHLYRLGEGYTRAPFALIGSLFGFALGFLTWNTLYLSTIVSAPVAWLPATLGYGGALALHLALLTVIGLALLRFVPSRAPAGGGQWTLGRLRRVLLIDPWNPLVTGALVGVIGVLAYLRVEPLGVTAQLGSFARTAMNGAGLLPPRLNGLDTFAGCTTAVIQAISDNGLLIGGLVLGSFAVALLGNRFQISQLTARGALTALLGGLLMGWGAMTALGCTVGTLLSGISAFAVAGWVFGAAMFVGVWVGIRLRLHMLT